MCWAVFICSFSILRNSQLESAVLPFAVHVKLKLSLGIHSDPLTLHLSHSSYLFSYVTLSQFSLGSYQVPHWLFRLVSYIIWIISKAIQCYVLNSFCVRVLNVFRIDLDLLYTSFDLKGLCNEVIFHLMPLHIHKWEMLL